MKSLVSILFILLLSHFSKAQINQDTITNLDELVIETPRLQLHFAEKSYSIEVIDGETIQNIAVNSMDELLQNLTGIDIRRRGIEGMQSDIYIRGGHFNQVLILIDGIRLEDLQTGHHNMNAVMSLENVERVEIIKGPAARIYGQNAMNGVVNFVSKNIANPSVKAQLDMGSFNTHSKALGYQNRWQNKAIRLYVQHSQSDGYRYNTDFSNNNAFLKGQWGNVQLLMQYAERDFGANGFYASPDYTEQYEETKTLLSSLQGKFMLSEIPFRVHVFWRQNEDDYVFLRDNPDYYHNIHINNRFGLGVNTTIENLGLGIEVERGVLESNNLGNHQRSSLSFFSEYRLKYLDEKLDITPGFSIVYHSDIQAFFYPGIDIGYRLSDNFKTYFNAGYTSRIPTYTNLYYVSPAEEGNENLQPEKAFSTEWGLKYSKDQLNISSGIFYRDISDLIDWIKYNQEDAWMAHNIGNAKTLGAEFQTSYKFKIANQKQTLKLSYTFLDESIEKIPFQSRYALNSYKHQLTSGLTVSLSHSLNWNLSYRYLDRIQDDPYHLLDTSMHYNYKGFTFKVFAQNLLNTQYFETNLVPMPGLHFKWGVSYDFLK